MKFSDIPQFIRWGNYTVNISWDYLESWINQHKLMVDLNPTFQRNHVWTKEQESKYVEFILQGGFSGRDIFWNCSSWMKEFNTPLVLIDGKQRIKAVRKFLNNELKIFNKYYFKNFEDKIYFKYDFIFHINNLKKESDVLLWYIQFNSGGTIHTKKEINKVKLLYYKQLEKEQE